MRVAIAMGGGGRRGFVGAVMVLGRIDAEAAQLDEARKRLAFAGLEQDAEIFDVRFDVIFMRSPIADFGGAVDEDVGVDERLSQAGGVGWIATDDGNASGFECLSIAARTRQSSDMPAAALTRLHEMAAYEPGGAGDENSHRFFHGEPGA